METFSAPRDFVEDPRYHLQREKSLQTLDPSSIDSPFAEIILGFAELHYCFTLQSCYGHFLYPGQDDRYDIDPLPDEEGIKFVEYRIAYLALCIEHNEPGRQLFDDLGQIPSIDPEYIQFGSAEWFWKRQVNSYALQVMPIRYKTKDSIQLDYREALHIEKTRNQFFVELKKLLGKRLGDHSPV